MKVIAVGEIYGKFMAKSYKKGLQITFSTCNPLTLLVGRAGVEPATNGLKVRCSTI